MGVTKLFTTKTLQIICVGIYSGVLLECLNNICNTQRDQK